MSVFKRALRTFDTASLSASYQNVGAAVGFPVLKVSITNTSTVGVLVNDGSGEDDIELWAGGTLTLSEGLSQSPGMSTKYVFSNNTQLRVKQVTGSAAGKLIINCFG